MSVLATAPLVRNRLDATVSSTHFLPLNAVAPSLITAAHNNLNIFMVTAKNPNSVDTSAFVFSLMDANKNTLRQIPFSGRNIGDPSDIRLQFEPLPDSAHLPLTVAITSDSADPGWVQFAVNDQDQFSFRSYYRSSNLFSALPTSFVLVDPYFFIVWAGLLVSLLLLSGPFRILGDRKFS